MISRRDQNLQEREKIILHFEKEKINLQKELHKKSLLINQSKTEYINSLSLLNKFEKLCFRLMLP